MNCLKKIFLKLFKKDELVIVNNDIKLITEEPIKEEPIKEEPIKKVKKNRVKKRKTN